MFFVFTGVYDIVIIDTHTLFCKTIKVWNNVLSTLHFIFNTDSLTCALE